MQTPEAYTIKSKLESSSSSSTSALTSDDTRETHSFLESDQILTLIPLLRGAGWKRDW